MPPSASPPAPRRVRDRLQLQTSAGTWPVEVDGPCFLDEAGQLSRGVEAGRGITLRPEAGGLVAQDTEGAPLHLNAVQVSGPVLLRPGDELRVGGLRASLLRETLVAPDVARPEALIEPWLEGAIARAAAASSPLELELGEGRGPPERPGEACFPVGPERWLLIREGAFGVAGRGVVVRAPRDGVSASALLARVLGAADVDEAPFALEPSTLRLSHVLEDLAALEGPLLVEGETGVGRAFRAGHWLRRRGYVQVQRVSGADPLAAHAIAAAPIGVGLLVEEVERLGREAQALLAQREGSWAATAWPGAALEPALAQRLARTRLFVPPLRDRPAELAAMVDAELLRLRQALGRPSLQLDRVARELVLGDPWTENLDGVRAALSRAAFVSQAELLRVEDLPVRLRAAVVEVGLTEAREAAERAILLRALQQSRWNVAETARRLGMPRRTLVHRMKVVGLKRPARNA